MADQESLDYFAHYDPVAEEIVEPLNTITLDTLNVREITCFKINLDEIVDADADINNGVTFEGDLFMADNSTAQLATVQGVAGAPIDYLDDINFDTNSGIKFGAGQKLDEHLEGQMSVSWGDASASTPGAVYFEKIGGTVTLTLSIFSGAFTSANIINTGVNVLSADLLPIEDCSAFALVNNNGSAITGFLSVSATGIISCQPSTGTYTSGTCGLFREASITYISDV